MPYLETFLIATLGIISLAFGAFCAKNPKGAIAFQQRFYERINWRITPVDMAKEIRNTKIMGFFLLLCGALTLFFALP